MRTHSLISTLVQAREITRTIAALLTLLASAAAQSTDRDRPTPLRSTEVRGQGVGRQVDYYYSFTAGPGEVRLTIDGTTKITMGGAAHVELFDMDAKRLLSVNIGNTGGRSQRSVARVEIGRRQPVLMRIGLSDSTVRYSVRVEGVVELEQPGPAVPVASAGRGKMRIEMSDGTTQEIDLSRVRRITIEP